MTRRFLILLSVLGFVFSAQSATAAEVTVPVRAGVHDRFNRIVLDWATPVKYTMQQDAGQVQIQFDHTARLAMGNFNATSLPFVKNFKSENNANGLVVTFTIPQKSRVQAFWSGQKVAFDVLRMDDGKPEFGPEPAKTDAPAAAPIEEQKAPETAEKPPEDKPVDEKPAEEKPVETPAPTAAVEAPPEKDLQPAATDEKSAGPQQPQALPNIPTLAQQMEIVEAANAKAIAAQAAPAPSVSNQSTDDNKDAASDEQAQTGTVIRFRLLDQSKMAVFVRSGRLWTVLSPAVKDVMPQVKGDLAKSLENATQIQTKSGTAFIFDLPASVNDSAQLTVKHDGLNWEVWFNNEKRQTPIAGVLSLKATGDDQTLSVDPDQPTQILPFDDKVLGDKIWVIPVLSPMLRVEHAQQLNSISTAPTILGGLLIPAQETLNVLAKGNQFLIRNNNGLLLSTEADRFKAEQQPGQEKLFKLNIRDEVFLQQLKLNSKLSFEKQRQALEHTISKQKNSTDRALHALDLARLYLGEGFGPEADGALQLAEKALPNLKETPDFIALKGMTFAVSNQSKRALDMLDDPEVRDAPLAQLWRAYAQALDKNWEKSYLIFKNVVDGFKDYPPHLRNRLLLSAIESAVETNHVPEARNFMKQLGDAELSKSQIVAKDYADAMIIQADNPEKAMGLLEKISKGNDHYYRVKAELSLLPTGIEDGVITVPQAIERLEKLRYAWRGDRQEVIVLRQLGGYYLQSNQPMQAMTLWQEAVSRSQNENDLSVLKKDLQKTFNEIFVEGKTDKLTDLQILAIYDRFKNLMPDGEAGQKAALRLVDQLLKVDLVDQADKILQDQFSNHATGEDAAKIGTKLATIRLIARNPAGALKALDESENNAVPADLAERRQLLRIRALADNQQIDQALLLLSNPLIPEGLSLRADLHWRQQQWNEAGADLQELIDNTTDKTAKNKLYTNFILRLAIVKALQNDELGLAQMAAQYSDLMKGTPQERAFAVMSQAPGETSLADLDTIKSQVAQVELFESFLKNF